MYIILFLLVIIFSSIFSFISSGTEHLILTYLWDKDVAGHTMNAIPLGYYFIGYFIGFSIFYKIKFKTLSRFKIFVLRNVSKLNTLFNKFDNKLSTDKIELSGMQQKAIQTWDSLLKDRITRLNSNLLTYNRTIQRGSMLVTLKHKGDTTLTVMDSSRKCVFYEVFIPEKYYSEMSLNFDRELDKRMNAIESKKRSELESVLNYL